jgi:hypothetical protein
MKQYAEAIQVFGLPNEKELVFVYRQFSNFIAISWWGQVDF